MTNKIILLITLLSYSIIVSQSFMYILSLRNTQMALGSSSYTEVRQLIDANMRGLFKYIVYGALLSSLLLMIVYSKVPGSFRFITAALSFAALLADCILTLKGNMPANNIINSWAPGNVPENWTEIRNEWFRIFQYRQVLNIAGFISLLAGAVFGGI